MRVTNRACDSVEGEARRLGRELNLSADVEESKVSIDEVVGNTGCLILEGEQSVRTATERSDAGMITYVNINLAAQDIFRLLESVVC